ncbi:MAG: MFS transporter [Ignavibacteria bacterium]|jgi:MFS family permease|nr:MFS transporter [Ignavibacteria bacterium]
MKDRKALLVIFLTIFIDLLGFGIIIPLLPDFSFKVLHIDESIIGILVGIYSLMQFIFTPVWGSLSDIYGRKPILIMSLSGNVISYALMFLVFSGIFPSVYLLAISRAFAGIFSANLSAAQAVISDITPPEERSKGMGFLGAAFGLGFVFGPALGGILSQNFGYGLPIALSGIFSLTALMLAVTILKETLPDDVRKVNKHNFSGVTFINLKGVKDVIKNKRVGVYVIIFFFITFSFANIYGTFLLFAERTDTLGLNQEQVGLTLSFLGVVGAIVQVSLIKLFRNKVGEERTVVIGNFLVIAGLALIPFSLNVPMLLLVLMILGLGNGLNNPMLMGLISQNVDRDEQGSVLGINQSLGSLARFIGPVWGGFIYKFGFMFPFLSGGFFMLLITLFSLRILKRN